MNLRLRLNLIVTAVLLVVLLIGAVSAIHNARSNVQAEVASTAILALKMLDTKILDFGMDSSWTNHYLSSNKSIFELKQLQDVRHIRVDFYDAQGLLRDSNHPEDYSEKRAVPQWFLLAMDTVSSQMPPTRRPVFLRGHVIGELVVTPDPFNEINEIWQETKTVFWLLCLFFIIVNIMIYFSVGKALKPIANILDALTELESGNLASRLPKFTLPELTRISDKFNVMADKLQSSIESNCHLTQQIIRLQEAERKSLAHELHDEIGQQLTAIHVDAAAILKARKLSSVKESAAAIVDVSKQMMEMVHNMLQRLRPGDLDELGIEVALGELVDSWCQRNSQVKCQLRVGGDFTRINDTVLVAIYRIVQEGLTNILRHAHASHVWIRCVSEAAHIRLEIEDDGCGFDTSLKSGGFGLAGMKERVQGLDGQFELETGSGKGVKICVRIPCQTGG